MSARPRRPARPAAPGRAPLHARVRTRLEGPARGPVERLVRRLVERLVAGVPVPLRRLAVHEIRLTVALLRWVARRGPHGVSEGGLAVPYASAQALATAVFLFVSVVETVALALLIPWPAVHRAVLLLDLWGIWFVVALHASCVVRPHVVGADGSLRLRYGALVDIRIPAGRIAAVRVERRYPDSRLAAVGEDGTADLGIGGQTTVTVELTEPLAFTRALGGRSTARAFRFYAEDPAATVAALRPAG
ncbi:hypothetical protein ACWGB8_13940 [Kitasatospora sp. NPDC054939]